jgi:hypothetical protein
MSIRLVPHTLPAVALLAVLPVFAQPADGDERWNAHVQTTYVRQLKPAFSSPYEGANSLRGVSEASYSATATASFGWRPWRGTELYFDPEAAQGVPFSGLLGLAGFPNGELAKTSGSHPTFYRARLFVRQTFALGGDTDAVASAAHQLAGRVARRRIVVTAGNLSVLDLFDANAYAHDPRTQFLNWALMTHAAYDYPADSRGYSTGAAVEYFDDGWSLRAARFQVPREPNQLRLDTRLGRHYGDQVELARDYRWGMQSGTARLLAFRLRAVMARYDDALALAGQNGDVPTLGPARTTEQSKAGVGVAFEHRLTPDVGLFARWMRADGKTETYAFTEVDRSVSAGVSVGGAAWRRSGDRLGLAMAESALSKAHRAFLSQGGTTFFLGDGRLRYRPEQIIEAYYSAALFEGAALTADWQHLRHPGYNADRGPVNVYGFRFHLEL